MVNTSEWSSCYRPLSSCYCICELGCINSMTISAFLTTDLSGQPQVDHHFVNMKWVNWLGSWLEVLKPIPITQCLKWLWIHSSLLHKVRNATGSQDLASCVFLSEHEFCSYFCVSMEGFFWLSGLWHTWETSIPTWMEVSLLCVTVSNTWKVRINPWDSWSYQQGLRGQGCTAQRVYDDLSKGMRWPCA